MDRRHWIAALACWPLARLAAQQPEPRPRHKVSAAELYERLSARFPVRLGMASLLEIEVSAPQLLLLPSRNKIGASLLAEASGSGLNQRRAGALDLVFALRYEAADQTLRAHQAEVLELRLPGLSADGQRTLQALLPQLARDAMGEFVLHKFSPRELALPETMGFEPEKITVLEDGLVVEFRQKAGR